MSSRYASTTAHALVMPPGPADHAPQAHCSLCGENLIPSEKDLTDTRFGVPNSYDVYRCSVCDVEQISPLPSLGDLKQLYEKEYNFGGETRTRYTKLRERFFFSRIYRFWAYLD